MTAKTVTLIGNTGITVECEGQVYQPEDEAYRPQYKYVIKTPEWEYVGNDIHGAVNEVPDTNKATQSLLAFLYACQESFVRNENGENATLFPRHVAEWAYQNSDEISMAAIEQEVANSLVATPVSDPDDTLEEVDPDELLHHCPSCGETCGVTDYDDGRCKDCHIMDTAEESGDDEGDEYTGPTYREGDDSDW